MRLDRKIEPTKSRGATVSSKEMARFREIPNVVRNGETKLGRCKNHVHTLENTLLENTLLGKYTFRKIHF